MQNNDTKIFKQILAQNKIVVGVDEAGRGPLAGPLTVGVVVYDSKVDLGKLEVADSKLLSDKKRRQLFEVLKDKVMWAVGVVSNEYIDKNGITKSVSHGVDLALKKIQVKPNFLMLDGRIKTKQDIEHQDFIKGDRRFELIGAASIMAKVWRDNLMISYAEKFPQYNFEKHKGYGTRNHYELIKKFGPCEIHRRSFDLHLT